ncbi:MAG: hypothetical protein NZO16_01480 [Deltaproteobacteria bacterium]|nr:hypothetical protein [Deltaproteobacteria bacterium]
MNPESLIFITLGLAIAPIVLGSLTCYLKISIVLNSLKTSFAAQNLPGQLVVFALSFVLTITIMNSVILETVQNFSNNPLPSYELKNLREWIQKFDPLRQFLARNASEEKKSFFSEKLNSEPTSWQVLIPSFVVTELQEAFELAILIYLPFLAIDIVVASILVTTGMFMVSPTIVSLPIKLGLIVISEPWLKLINSLILSYN